MNGRRCPPCRQPSGRGPGCQSVRAAPERLLFLAVSNSGLEGRLPYNEAFDYPTFRQYRQILEDRADVMLVGTPNREDDFLDSGEEPEPLYT